MAWTTASCLSLMLPVGRHRDFHASTLEWNQCRKTATASIGFWAEMRRGAVMGRVLGSLLQVHPSTCKTGPLLGRPEADRGSYQALSDKNYKCILSLRIPVSRLLMRMYCSSSGQHGHQIN